MSLSFKHPHFFNVSLTFFGLYKIHPKYGFCQTKGFVQIFILNFFYIFLQLSHLRYGHIIKW